MRAAPLVVPATDAHCIAMAPRLRGRDCREIIGIDPLRIMRASLGRSTHAWTWILDGEPAAMFGLRPRTLVGAAPAIAWLFTTDAIRRDLRTFLLGSRAILSVMLDLYPAIEGCVDERFLESIQWLRRLGFRIGEPFEFSGFRFRHFVKESST